MIFSKNKQQFFADIHCHLLPYVDDGASDMEDARTLIGEEYSQGVRLLVLTPHWRDPFFDTSVDVLRRHFEELKEWATSREMDGLRLYLGREYFCDARFEAVLDGYDKGMEVIEYNGIEYSPGKEIVTFGDGECILLEFSSALNDIGKMMSFTKKVLNIGFTPVIVHPERYQMVRDDVHTLDKIREIGGFIQVNADAIIGLEGRESCETARMLVAEGMVDLVASDAHDPEERKPRLKQCFKILSKRIGREQADWLMRGRAYQLIQKSD